LLYQSYFKEACSGQPLFLHTFYTYAPNDVTWHESLGKLAVISPNVLTLLNTDGSSISNIVAAGAYAGITYVKGREDCFYLGQLYPSAIKEFNITTKQVTRTFPILLAGANATLGLESLTFVPDDSTGHFWVGSSVDGSINIYKINVWESSPNITYISNFTPLPNITNLLALSYEHNSDLIYGIGGQWLFSVTSKGMPVNTFILGLKNPNGVAVVGDDIFISSSDWTNVWKFPFSPSSGISSGDCTPKVDDIQQSWKI